MKVHYPKLYNMAHLSLNVFTASKGSNNYILFAECNLDINILRDSARPQSLIETFRNSIPIFFFSKSPFKSVGSIISSTLNTP